MNNGLVDKIPEYSSRDQLDSLHSISVDFTHPNCVLDRKDNRFYLLSYHYDTHSNTFLVFGLTDEFFPKTNKKFLPVGATLER